jgi:CRP-like cAMP-binding protein
VTRRALLQRGTLQHFTAGTQVVIPQEENFHCVLAGKVTIIARKQRCRSFTPGQTVQDVRGGAAESNAEQWGSGQVSVHPVAFHGASRQVGLLLDPTLLENEMHSGLQQPVHPIRDGAHAVGTVQVPAALPDCMLDDAKRSLMMSPRIVSPTAADAMGTELRQRLSGVRSGVSSGVDGVMEDLVRSIEVGSEEGTATTGLGQAREVMLRVAGTGDVWGVGEDDVPGGPDIERFARVDLDSDVLVLSAQAIDDILQVGRNPLPSATQLAALCPALAQFHVRDLEDLLDVSIVQQYDRGVQVLSDNEVPQCVLVVLSGMCDVYCNVLGGVSDVQACSDRVTTVDVRQVQAGGLLGFSGAIFGSPLWASARTSTHVTLLSLPSRAIATLAELQDIMAALGVGSLQESAQRYEGTLREDAMRAHVHAVQLGAVPQAALGPHMAHIIREVTAGKLSVAGAAMVAPFPVPRPMLSPYRSGSAPPRAGLPGAVQARSASCSSWGARLSRLSAAPFVAQRQCSSSGGIADGLGEAPLDPEHVRARHALLAVHDVATGQACSAAALQTLRSSAVDRVVEQHPKLAYARPAQAAELPCVGDTSRLAQKKRGPIVAGLLLSGWDDTQTRMERTLRDQQQAYEASSVITLGSNRVLRLSVPFIAEPSGENWAHVPTRRTGSQEHRPNSALSLLEDEHEADVAVSRLLEHGKHRMPASEVLERYVHDPNSLAACLLAERHAPRVSVHRVHCQEYRDYFQQLEEHVKRQRVLDTATPEEEVLTPVLRDWVGMWKVTKARPFGAVPRMVAPHFCTILVHLSASQICSCEPTT